MIGLGISSAQINRASITPDGNGNNIKAWNSVASGVTCRLVTMSAHEVAAHSTLEVRMSHDVQFTGYQDVRKEDHILIGTRVFIIQDVLPTDQFGGKFTVAQCLEIVGRAE